MYRQPVAHADHTSPARGNGLMSQSSSAGASPQRRSITADGSTRNVQGISVQGFDINIHSQAGYATTVCVKSARDRTLNIAFDMGICTPAARDVQRVFLSHGHADHVGALAMHARAKFSSKGTYYVAQHIMEPLSRMKEAMEAMDESETNWNLVPIVADGQYPVSNGWVVVPFQTQHRVPSLGFKLYKQHSPSNWTLELCYTGDTLWSGLEQHADVFEAKVLIMECTYVCDKCNVERARSYGHIHLDEIVANAARFRNQHIILMHFSARYTGAALMDNVARKVPRPLLDRLSLSLEHANHPSPELSWRFHLKSLVNLYVPAGKVTVFATRCPDARQDVQQRLGQMLAQSSLESGNWPIGVVVTSAPRDAVAALHNQFNTTGFVVRCLVKTLPLSGVDCQTLSLSSIVPPLKMPGLAGQDFAYFDALLSHVEWLL